MPIGDIYQATITQTMHEQFMNNVLHYRVATEGAGNGGAILGAAVGATVVSLFKPLCSDEWVYNGTVCQKVFPKPPLAPVFANAGAGAGAYAGNAIPGNAPCVITKRTMFAGPKYRGRMYISGLSTADEENGQIVGSTITALNAYAAQLLTPYSVSGWEFVPILFHRSTNTYTDINEWSARPILRNMRRRQIGKGV